MSSANRIDRALDAYYQSMGIYTYYDQKTGHGKFLKTYIDEEYNEDAIVDELGDSADFTNCSFLDYLDDEFPLKNNNMTQTEKQQEIFRILRKCYKDGPNSFQSNQNVIPGIQPIQNNIIPGMQLNIPKPQSLIPQTTDDYRNQMKYGQIKSWLNAIKFSADKYENDKKLQKYFEILVTNGYESLEQIVAIDDNTKERKKQLLQKMGFDNAGIRTKMIAEIARLRESEQFVPLKVNKRPMYDTSSDEDDDKDQDELIFYEEAECNSNDVKECGYIQRLLDMFIKYEDWNQHKDTDYGKYKWDVLAQLLDTSCELTNLMDDFHHFREKHDQNDTISFLKKQIANESMNEFKCCVDHITENHHIALTEKSLDTVQILKLHILDNFHLQFMHNDETPQGLGIASPTYGNSEFDDDEYGDAVPVLVKKEANELNNELKNNKVFIQHQSECSKFVTQGPQNAVDFSKIKAKKEVNINLKIENQPVFNLPESLSIDYSAFDSDDEEDDDGNNDSQMPSYSFGKTWYYWKYYKENQPTGYIAARYDTFKMELLCNKIYKLPVIDWVSTRSQAKSYFKCKNARGLKPSGILLRYYYGNDVENSGILQRHIMAILFYCNYDKLQKSLSETFRIMQTDYETQVENASIWEAVKQRNAEYANWTRLLREAVELYGKTMRDTPDITLYHGISSEMVFDSINCKFCAPTSMTTSLGIAQSFSEGFGLILTLNMYDFDLRYFDVSWLSNYPTEEEKILIGGNATIRIQSITLGRLGHNYKHYMLAIGIIQNMFDARHIPIGKEIDNKTMNAINNLLFTKYKGIDSKEKQKIKPKMYLTPDAARSVPGLFKVKSLKTLQKEALDKVYTKKNLFKFDIVVDIPEYVGRLFDYFCAKWDKKITIDIAKFNKNNEYRQFKQSLYRTFIAEDNSYVALDLICVVFQNVTCIHVINGFKFTQNVFVDLYDGLRENAQDIFNNLTEIKIEISSTNTQNIDQIKANISEMMQSFAKINWDIGYVKTYIDIDDEKKDDIHPQNMNQYVVLVKTQSTVR